MKLLVHVIEARNLVAMDPDGSSDPYVKIQFGKHKAKTKVMKKNLNPLWDEEFSFNAGDVNDELIVRVYDEDKYTSDFLGKVKIPIQKVLDEESLSLGTMWYPLQPKGKKSKTKDCGEIRLTIHLCQINSEGSPAASSFDQSCHDDLAANSDSSAELTNGRDSLSSNDDAELNSVQESRETEPQKVESSKPLKEESTSEASLFDRFRQIFGANTSEPPVPSTRDVDLPAIQEITLESEASENQSSDVSSMPFDDLLNTIKARGQEGEMPTTLPGGVVLDQIYAVKPADMNSLLFSPNSNFWQSLAEIQGTTGFQAEPWRLEDSEKSLKRIVVYTKAATKMVKAVKATEEQTYLKADEENFAVLLSVSTPDVPFGNCFRCEVLFSITAGPELSNEEQSTHLIISWCMNFLQSTMMKGMIENGARQGVKESYLQFADLLSQNVKPVEPDETASTKEQILASLQTEQESGFKLARRFFGNFTVISSVLVALYISVHIFLANSPSIQGLEFSGLDLPDSLGEVVVSGILVLQGERVLNFIGRYLQARNQAGSDHGIKAQGDGWLLTIALLEGNNFAAVDSTGYSDPYVVFTCNGKTKTSSIKFQTLETQWNEIFEFDAMDNPPSRMDIDVYDFDGPFDVATPLGHAEVNFVKSNLSDLADIWIPLQGNLAQACQSKLHLRIFLNNSRGTELATHYLTKMEKEVGLKMNMRSPQTNLAFQKLFRLPLEEFLINDFTCHLKRRIPLQGRLFLSPRIIGFHSNLFGHKTKFFFLWEDIDDIQVIPPSLASMGSPSLLVILRKGRGIDAKHGAKALDPDGRLKFQFQSFVSFNVANRTIMALWKARALSPEQKMQIVEEESGASTLQSEDSGSFLGVEETKLSEVFSSDVNAEINSLMELFEGGSLERRVMEKVGCVDYSITPWETVKSGVYQRQIHYKFDKNLSRYGGEVTSTQQKSPLPHKNGWIIEEVMALQGVLLGDYFNLHLRYQIEDPSPKLKTCHVQASLGIAWLKSTKHRKRISKNVISNSSLRIKQMFSQVENEFKTLK